MSRVLMITKNTMQLVSSLFLVSGEYSSYKCDVQLSGKVGIFQSMYESSLLKDIFDRIELQEFDDYAQLKNIMQKLKWRINTMIEIRHQYKNVKYDEVFLFPSSLSQRDWIMVNVLKKKNPGMKVNIFDEGLQAYLLDAENGVSLMSRLIRKMKSLFLGYFYEQQIEESLYLFEPELYVGSAPYDIKKITITNKAQKVVQDIFAHSFEKGMGVNERNIFFEEAYDQFENSDEYRRLCNNALMMLGVDNTVVKGHPRNARPVVEARRWELEVPWEVYCIACPEALKEKRLISVLSTTCYMPFLLGVKDIQSYYLFPCYKYSINAEKYSGFNRFMDRLIERYSEIRLVKDINQLAKL